MKILPLLFAYCTISAHLAADAGLEKSIAGNRLKTTCTIKIMREKLLHANNSLPIESRVDEVGPRLLQLYQACSTVINPADQAHDQPDLSAITWVNKGLREIYSLQQDPETKNCYNQSIKLVNAVSDSAIPQDAKIIAQFFDLAQNCAHQQALKVSRPELDAQINRWDTNQSKKKYDLAVWNLLLKHSPEKQSSFEADLTAAYSENSTTTMLPIENFAENIGALLKKLESDQQGRACLQDILDFHDAFYATTDDQEKENLKNSFAISYLQCKSR